MLLTTIKLAGNWDFLGIMFLVGGPTFEQTVMKIINKVSENLYESAVENINEKYTMDRLIRKENTFHNQKHVRYATDVTF